MIILELTEQNQDDNEDPNREDHEHDNQFLAIHTFLPSFQSISNNMANAKCGVPASVSKRSNGSTPFGVQKKPWKEPGPEGRKGVIAFSRTRSKIFFDLIEE